MSFLWETNEDAESKKGKFFLACTGYPSCHETSLIDVELVEQYFIVMEEQVNSARVAAILWKQS
mgnify:CR=1 FL=1